MDEVRKLEERVRIAENTLAEVTTTTKFHGRELRTVRQHLNSMDRDKITPIQSQVDDIHKHISRDTGFRDGKTHSMDMSLKRIGTLISFSLLIVAVTTLALRFG